MILAFTGLALAAEAGGYWLAAAIVADVAIVAASSYSAYSSAQMQKENAKAQAEIQRRQAEAYEMQAKDLERQSQIEQEKGALAQLQAEQEAEQRSRVLASDIGSLYANAAGNGLLVDAGSNDTFAHVLTSTVGEAQRDISTIKDNARISIWEHDSNAKSLLVSAKTSRISRDTSLIGAAVSKKNARSYNTASYLGAATAGISSAAGAISSGFQGAEYANRYGSGA